MPKKCPNDRCDAILVPADDLDCQKATLLCPECAPQFVVANATSFVNVEDPLPSGDS